MANEQIKQEITSVLSEAGKGVSFWMDYLDSSALDELQKATAVIKTLRQQALQRQKSKLS
ncbi:MAG TPA: hypothetical protein VG860_21570 [Terriglobia bacterium]|jgi:hypothetical protein|nr:hypothetical protein [Terriglobia bacterium]